MVRDLYVWKETFICGMSAVHIQGVGSHCWRGLRRIKYPTVNMNRALYILQESVYMERVLYIWKESCKYVERVVYIWKEFCIC